MSAPILIVGAGPTGLVLALLLHRHGIPFRIIDQHDGPGEASRALVVHARTLEFYSQLGLADRVIAAGTKVDRVRGEQTAHRHCAGRTRARSRFDDVRTDVQRLLGVVIDDVNWFSTYRVHHRVASRFQSGRAFLLGDAGHLHSPVGGQGMNTGIGDAVNLGWKLATVVTGRGSPYAAR